ncbi:MAG: NAD(P)-dependent oxidoreductase [Lachnospira sp.]|nr:NAD(P)-dependent oxidoreductase [Lachnospira sp.]
MSLHVLDEADRCLQCKNPRCREGCPIHTDIPNAIRLLREGNLNEAGWMLFENNPLTTVCSLICNHENQCEGHCVRGIKGAPVHFSVIENYISETYANQMTKGPSIKNGQRVAIIGSGPAGLTIAVILQRYGYDVTIFEGKDKIGGVLRYGIPEFRLPKSVLDDFEYRHLRMKNIKIRPNTTIGMAITISDLFRDGYSSIFIGTGVWKPNVLHIKGETFGNVHFGINYLNNPDSYQLGSRVSVIGAGNAAMDVARTAIRKGVRHLTCFSLTKKIAASAHEFSYAQLEGVDFEYNWKPVQIQDDGVIFRKVEEQEDGTLTEIPDSDRFFPSDSVIISISQGPQNRLVNTTRGLHTNDRGLLEADDTGHTSVPGIFASGDVVAGARTVVEAVAHSKVVAESMHKYMQGLKTGATHLPTAEELNQADST